MLALIPMEHRLGPMLSTVVKRYSFQRMSLHLEMNGKMSC